MNDSAQPQIVADYACHTGENPLWHTVEGKLYWTDIPTGRLFQYDPRSGLHEQIYSGRSIGGLTFQKEGGLLLFMDRGAIAHWRNGVLTEWLAGIPSEEDSRFNDVIADSLGRVFCGTMSSDGGKGKLYRLDRDGTLHVVLEGIGISNGMAFNCDRRNFYYTDSLAGEIYRFDYDEVHGEITNQQVFARFTAAEGTPDGCTIDSEDHLWSALWDGGCIVRLSPKGTVQRRFLIPTLKTSSLAFAGDDFGDLYITTAGGEDKEVNGPSAGALFRLKSGYTGVAESFSRIAESCIVPYTREVTSQLHKGRL